MSFHEYLFGKRSKRLREYKITSKNFVILIVKKHFTKWTVNLSYYALLINISSMINMLFDAIVESPSYVADV